MEHAEVPVQNLDTHPKPVEHAEELDKSFVLRVFSVCNLPVRIAEVLDKQ